MTDWTEMTYDEQRAFLGLPDVRRQVAFMRLGLQIRGIKEAFTAMGVVLADRSGQIQKDFALARGGTK